MLFSSGCGSGEPLPYANQIEKVAGTDAQVVPSGGRPRTPLAVIVRSNEGGILPRVKVRWKVASGAGAVSDSITLSDADGRAQVDFVAGPAAGPGSVHAELAVNFVKYVTFTTTTAVAPTLVAAVPAEFTGGDIVTLQGTGLEPGAMVEVSGAPARVVSGTATSLDVAIPVCLAPGQVTLRVRATGGASNVINGTYVASSAPVSLAVGDYASIDPARLQSCATFPAAGPGGAEYLIAPQATTATPGLSAAYRLVGDSVVQMAIAPLAQVPPLSAATAFHDFLRQREQEISRLPRPSPVAAGANTATPPIVPVKLGDQRTFRVCSKLDCKLLGDFPRIDARARFVGEHVAVFQDLTAPANGFTDAEIASLGQTFDDVLYDVDTRAFGVESDIDGNGVVLILMTPTVNRLTPRDQCTVAFISGFFYAIDLDPTFTADPRANPGELFYSLVPDPDGSVNCVFTKDRLTRIIPTTFIHEFQHMINYNQHVLLRRKPLEQLWLNEGMSHLAEELGGLKFKDMGQPQIFSDFVLGDLYDAYQYLKTPGAYFTLFGEGAGTLAERGSAWLFLRWLVDHFGVDLTRRLSETPLVGTENIASATGEPVARLLSQWFLANYVSDLPDFTPPARLQYETWRFRTTFASLHQQLPANFDRAFPLEPFVASGGSFDASGTVRSGSGDYFRVTQASGQRGFTLRFTDPAGNALGGATAPRLNVIRLK